MSTEFQGIQHIQPGEPVSAGVTGRPARQLEARTNELKGELARIEEGRLLLWKEQRLDPLVLEGQPVFWNDVTQRFEQAMAAVEVDTATGTLVPRASCGCIGLCYRKQSSSLGDIVIGGVAAFSSMTDGVDGAVTPGRYYLSPMTPGKLVKQRPPASVPVCIVFGPTSACDTNSWVYVLPQLGDFVENHVHYRFDLYCAPAGTTQPVSPGGVHSITVADAAQPGWLPAGHATFADHAPVGAKFGYNLAAHPQLAGVWPPIPVESAILLRDRGDSYGAAEVPTRGEFPLVVFDRFGIWWMSDCYDDVPWPVWYDNIEPGLSLPVTDSSEVADCPRYEPMRLVLGFAYMLFTTQRTVVTSLHPAVDSPIEFVNCNGEAAATGDLWARLQLAVLLDTAEHYGGNVLKELVGPGLRFGAGWVTEGLISDSEYLTLSSTHQRGLDPALPVSGTNPAVHQGVIHLDAVLDPSARELSPQIVRLGDATDRIHKDVPYIGFPPLRDSSIRMRLDVPAVGLPGTPQLQLRVLLFGRATGALPELTLSYQRLPRPTAGVPTVLSVGDTPVVFPTEAVAVTVDAAIEITSAAFTVAAGDTVLVSIARASTAGYDTGEVGIIRAVGVITSVA